MPHPKITYPADHLVGMRVPVGGSDCAKCKYVREHDCSNDLFVKWNNGNRRIPEPTNEYCCDLYEEGRIAGAFRERGGDSEYA